MKNEINEAKRICEDYLERGVTPMDELRMLDARVKRPANLFAYVFGGAAAMIMGGGMSLVMTDLAEQLSLSFDPMAVGVVIGVVGLVMALVNYPIYKRILAARRRSFAPEILALGEKIAEAEG